MGLLVKSVFDLAPNWLLKAPMWQMTFFHKVILTLVAAACTAGMIEFYRNFVQGADEAINGSRGAHIYIPHQVHN